MAGLAARIGRLLPGPLAAALRPVKQQLGAWRDESAVALAPWGRPAPLEALRPGPVVVTGLRDNRGLGRAARETVRMLRALGLRVIEHDAGPYLYSAGRALPEPDVSGGVWICQVNPPEHRRILRLSPRLAAAPMLRVGYWVYELPQAPADWLRARAMTHEVWAPSAYAAASLGGARVVRHPRPQRFNAAPDRARFGLPDSACVFLAFADAQSSLARKNPEGAIEAFARSRAESETGARLVIKLSGARQQPRAAALLEAKAAQVPGVRVLSEDLDAAGLASLFASADVLVSLHRSEGFGLTVAEAMANGKPAIVTDYSGVTDFIDERACVRIPYMLTPVRDPQDVYRRADQSWAEPDLAAASQAMERLASDAALREAMAAAAASALAERLSEWRLDDLGADFARLAERA